MLCGDISIVPKGASLLYRVNTGIVPLLLDGGAAGALNPDFKVCLLLLNY